MCNITKYCIVLGCFSCVWLCNPMDCSLPGSSVHGILQARILKWIAMLSFRVSSWPKEQTFISYVSRIGRQVLYHCKSKPDGASGKEPTYNAGDIRSGLDGVATVENYLEVSQKTKNRIMIYPAICTPEYISKKENEKYDLKKIHTPQHS